MAGSVSRRRVGFGGAAVLTAATIGGVNTLNGLRPLGRRRRGAVASFAAGVITTEKPMLVLAGQALLAGAAWRMGGRRLRDRTAVAGAVITAASWSGLLAMRWRARGSDELFDRARTFARLLRAESRNPVLYAELPGAQHAFELFDSPRARASARAVERFLDVVYGDYLRGAVDPGAPDSGSAPAEPATAARRYPGATDRAGLGGNLVSG